MSFMYNVGINLVRMDLEFQVLCMKLEKINDEMYRPNSILDLFFYEHSYATSLTFNSIYNDIGDYLHIDVINFKSFDKKQKYRSIKSYKEDLPNNIDKINKLNNLMYNDYAEVSDKRYYLFCNSIDLCYAYDLYDYINVPSLDNIKELWDDLNTTDRISFIYGNKTSLEILRKIVYIHMKINYIYVPVVNRLWQD